MPWRPRLFWTHRNFAIGLLGLAVIFDFGVGVTQFTNPDRYAAPSLDKVYELAPRIVWGAAFLLAFVLIVAGVYTRFSLARAGLALTVFLCVTRGLLIELSNENPGAGIFVWAAFAVWAFTMASEPQANPLTARQRRKA